MTEQMSSRPWLNRNGEQKEPVRLLLNDFVALAHEYVLKIKQVQPSLQQVYTTFNERSEIEPDECDYLLNALDALYPPLHSLLELCTKSEHLPLIVIPLRHQLISELSLEKVRAQRLAQLAQTARSAYRVASNRTVRELCAFINCLEMVLQVSENILVCSQILFDQIRFLERH